MEIKCWDWISKRPPCQAACPAGTDVPGYVVAAAQGRYADAYQALKDTLPLPAICAYICHHPCESKCVRGRVDEPISIKSVKRFVTDWAASQPAKKAPAPKKADTERQKVAIIGSGPAGLAAAQGLALKGYDVTVFEALPVAGGMLAVGIPEFVLPRKVLQSEIDAIESLGVKIRTNTRIGKDISFDDLRQQYKGIFIAIGKQNSAKLNLPGMDAQGVVPALSFLADANLGKLKKLTGKVAIIGGGNVAMDCARAAVRLGASEVFCACLEKEDQMLAFEWEVDRAVAEGVKLFCGRTPQQVVTSNGKVCGLQFADVESIKIDEAGRFLPVACKGTECTMEADTLIVAIGQSADVSFLQGVKGLEFTKRGALAIDPDSLSTGMPGVFAGGDITAPAGTAVDAIAAGKKAAQNIDRFLRGDTNGKGALAVDVEVPDDRLPKFVQKRKRQEMPLMDVSKRKKTFDVVEQGFSEKVAVQEASRCLNCPMCGNCMFDRSQMCFKTASRLL
ncbi:MAG: FAD-dependent oxidoreductase [Chloroflexi bacterium]|nr:FAD-dependent oxidoreductase [Chloroflexota bacterium]